MNSRTQRKKYGYKYRRSWLLRAIVIDQVDGRIFGRGPYHNIRHASWSIARFMQAIKVIFPTATHVNFYDHSGRYQFQERYTKEQPSWNNNRSILQFGYYDAFFPITGQNRWHNDLVYAQFDP